PEHAGHAAGGALAVLAVLAGALQHPPRPAQRHGEHALGADWRRHGVAVMPLLPARERGRQQRRPPFSLSRVVVLNHHRRPFRTESHTRALLAPSCAPVPVIRQANARERRAMREKAAQPTRSAPAPSSRDSDASSWARASSAALADQA